MITLHQYVDTSVKAVCPITGVSFVDPTNPATWRIDFLPEATQTQRDAAQTVVTNALTTYASYIASTQAKDDQCLAEFNSEQLKVIKAFVKSLLPVLNDARQNPTTTRAAITETQAYNALRDEYRNL